MKKLYKIILAIAIMSMALTSCSKKEEKQTNTQENTTQVAQDNTKKEESTDKQEIDRKIFVDPQYVKYIIDGKSEVKDYVIVEATWGEAKDSPDYLKENGHIKGAIHVNTDSIEE